MLVLVGDSPPQCEHCQCILTVTVHDMLVIHPHLHLVRNDVLGHGTVVEMFRFHSQHIITFFRETGFHHKFIFHCYLEKPLYVVDCTSHIPFVILQQFLSYLDVHFCAPFYLLNT